MHNTIKNIVGMAVSVGVGQVVKNLLVTTTPKNLDKIAKVSTFIGGMVITGLVSNVAKDYAMSEYDEIVSLVDSIKTISNDEESSN